jgi:adenosylcobinamide-GDP ribazoletransferase
LPGGKIPAARAKAVDKKRFAAQNGPMRALRPFVHDLAVCLRFYSRLNGPLARDANGLADFSEASRAIPAAGAIIGGCGGGALLFARIFGAPPLPAAVVAIATIVVVTGALHEDGLADVADGFGGGATRERKLEIMRDSRLGSYGAAALALGLMLRAFALAALAERSSSMAALALVSVGAVSRTAGLAPLLLLGPARRDGAGAAMPRPTRRALRLALVLAGAASFLPVLVGLPLSQVLGADFVAGLAAVFFARLAERQIGGYSGDVLGAAQQAAEIAALLVLCAR